MTKEQVLQDFFARMEGVPLPDLSKEENYFAFCEGLSRLTAPQMRQMDHLRLLSQATSMSRAFG